MASLDAELGALLAEKDFFDRNPSAGSLVTGPDEPLYISLRFSGDIAAIEQAGLKVGSVGDGIAFGVTNLAGLQALAALPQVSAIYKQRRLQTHLNNSVPDIKANQVWGQSGDNFSGYTGRNVIVGVIDTGIDFKHQNFRKADGTTRILSIWDQTLTGEGGETVPGAITTPQFATPLNYGVEYDTQQINDALQSSSPAIPVRHVDLYGHGTHVAGIAAGDGSQAGACLGAYRYIGVAPEADIIAVRMWGPTPSDLTHPPPAGANLPGDAIRYILNQAFLLNKPAVINISLGIIGEYLDGSSPECMDVDKLLQNNSQGHAIVYAAGNDAANGFHASGTVAANAGAISTLNFKLFANDSRQSRSIVIFASAAGLQVQLTSPIPGANGVVPWVASGPNPVTNPAANGNGGSVTVMNKDQKVSITITSPKIANSSPTAYQTTDGTWKIELKNTTASAVTFDAYCVESSGHFPLSPRFLNSTSSRSTLSETATGKESISVGSYKVGGRLAEDSSRGPTLDGRTKPELCAPGVDITSALSSADEADAGCVLCCCACCHAYTDKSGTSMAAPHIAGVIALMLHKNPTLTHTQIRDTLVAKCRAKPADSTSDEDPGWGAGLVNANDAVGAVAQVNPPVAARIAIAAMAVQPDPVIAARDQLLATARGAEFTAVFQRYIAEIRTLINTNRRVAAVWHRCNGPVWVRQSIRAIHTPGMPVPTEAAGVRLDDALHRFGAVLKRYASASFRSDIQRYESDFVLISEGMSISRLIDLVGNRYTVSNLTEQAMATH